ncbi:MAG: GHKL domain-containing protein [Anaerolineales bacterium]|nr:GHKL domain-containing protein [Anaerolineales bacterium]
MLKKLREWASNPSFEGDEHKTRLAGLLNTILWIFILTSSIYGLFAPIESALRIQRIIIIAPFILTMLGLKQFVNQGHVRLVGYLIVFSLWLIFTVAMFFGADFRNPAFMGYLIVIICAGLILHWRAAISWSIFCIFTSAVILGLGKFGILRPLATPTPIFAVWAVQSMYILTATFLIGQTLNKIDDAWKNAERELAERRRLEVKYKETIKELESKNAELERFTYTVSHDLKSPLITIGGFIGLLEEDMRSGNTAKFHKDLERISDAKDKMHRLLNELLELSRIGRLVNKSTDTPFAKIIDDALILTRGRIMASNVQVTVDKDLPTVTGDSPRLVEVMQNLIDNAAKFTIDQPNPQIHIGMRDYKGETVFYIKDNGIGIDPAYHEKVFGLFDKLNPKSEGTGVGLALVKRIIEVHGGRIWVESDGIEQGSTFYFTLPIK